MANCEIKNPPVWTDEIPKWDKQTDADGDAMGAVIEALLNNDAHNKKEIDQLDEDKVDISGGDIANTKVSEFTAFTDEYPVPEEGEAPKTLWGKVKKFMQDMRSAARGACYIYQLVSNTTTNNANLPASAAAVYQLNQAMLNYAPKAHASSAATYGQGNASNYGHVKLADGYTSSAGAAANGVAASSKALADAYAVLNTNSQEALAALNLRGVITELVLEQRTLTGTAEVVFTNSVSISAGTYLVFLNAIARSASSERVDLIARYNGNDFLLGRIPNTNGLHMGICMNSALYLPESTITFSAKRQAADGEVVFFGGSLYLIRLR